MEPKEIAKYVDHTLLTQTATWEEIKSLIDDGIRYEVATVCIPPSYVKKAHEYSAGRLRVCTVIGFPHGYNTKEVKVFETKDAVANGADEIDMVVNLGWVKDAKWDDIIDEIKAIKSACDGHLLKVIVETSMLTEDEKIKLCEIVTESGADFIKTSTGFGGGGATFSDVELFAKHIGEGVSIKASGGIKSLEDAERFIELGAKRLGTSRVIKIIKE